MKVGAERGRGHGPQEPSCLRVRTIPSEAGTLLLLLTPTPTPGLVVPPPPSDRVTMRGTGFGLQSNCTTSLS